MSRTATFIHDAIRPRAIASLCAADGELAQLIETVSAEPFSEAVCYQSTFHALARSIVYQQLSGKAAATIYGRVEACLGGVMDAAKLRACESAVLRGAGLSNNKMLALQDLAQWQCSGRLPSKAALERMDDAAVIETLSAIRGVGRWTAEMLLMFWLQRSDIWPAGDLGVRKGYALLKGLDTIPDAKSFTTMGDVYSPYRSFAAWYMWRATECLAP